MSELRPYNPQDDSEFVDAERDNRGSVDPTSYSREEAALANGRCRLCTGMGFVHVFDPDYDGGRVINYFAPNGEPRYRVGITVAYCTCLLGRNIEENHRQHVHDVHKRMLDFADIKGRSSYWLERDPTARELTESDIAELPQGYREFLARRMRVIYE